MISPAKVDPAFDINSVFHVKYNLMLQNEQITINIFAYFLLACIGLKLHIITECSHFCYYTYAVNQPMLYNFFIFL